jgi:hypothetical protein
MQIREFARIAQDNAPLVSEFVRKGLNRLFAVRFSAWQWVLVPALVLTRIAISRIRARCLFCGRKRGDFDNDSFRAFLGCELV